MRRTPLSSRCPLRLLTARKTKHVRASGYSFCIITDGRRPERLREELASIHALRLPAFEIIVVGDTPPELSGVTLLSAPEFARAGRLGAMRNLACEHAAYDHLIVADDDMLFHADFVRALEQFGASDDVLCVRLLNPDGSRYWDWATHGGPRGHVLMDYTDTDEYVYVTGGLAIMKAHVHERVRWDDARGFYAGEDLDWSARLRAAGMRIRFCADATVTHCDARYTQHGKTLRFRQDLQLRERVITDVEGTGFYRALEPGFRWMCDTGALHVAAHSAPDRLLHFSLASVAPALLPTPFRVSIRVNGQPAGAFTFVGAQSFSAAVPLATNAPLIVQLESDRSTSGCEVGLDDERPVSVLLHDVQIKQRMAAVPESAPALARA